MMWRLVCREDATKTGCGMEGLEAHKWLVSLAVLVLRAPFTLVGVGPLNI